MHGYTVWPIIWYGVYPPGIAKRQMSLLRLRFWSPLMATAWATTMATGDDHAMDISRLNCDLDRAYANYLSRKTSAWPFIRPHCLKLIGSDEHEISPVSTWCCCVSIAFYACSSTIWREWEKKPISDFSPFTLQLYRYSPWTDCQNKKTQK